MIKFFGSNFVRKSCPITVKISSDIIQWPLPNICSSAERILYRIKQFQKIPNTIPWMGFRNSKGKGEFFELEIQRHGRYLRLEFWRHVGVQDLEFPQGKDKSVFLENTYLMAFYYNQFKNKARTDEDADTHKKQPDKLFGPFKLWKNMFFRSRELF